MRLKENVCFYALRFLKKQQIKIIWIGAFLALFGMLSFLFTIFRSLNINYQHVNKPSAIYQFSGLSVDSKGNIYIGERESSLVQIFNEKGGFLYGFYVGTSQWCVFDIDSQDRLHIVGARGPKYEIFYGGELISSIKINPKQDKQLEKIYRSSTSKVFKTDDKIYKYSFFNKIVVTDINNNEKKIISLPVPLWPWAVYVYFIFFAIGLLLLYSGTLGIYKLEECLEKFKT